MLFSLHPHLGFILVHLAARQSSGASLDLLSLHPHLPAANYVQSSLRTEYALTLQVVDSCRLITILQLYLGDVGNEVVIVVGEYALAITFYPVHSVGYVMTLRIGL